MPASTMDLLVELTQLRSGDVIRWQSGRYTYVALNVSGRWYTTATDANSQVDQILSSAELVNHLLQSLAVVEVAKAWSEI